MLYWSIWLDLVGGAAGAVEVEAQGTWLLNPFHCILRARQKVFLALQHMSWSWQAVGEDRIWPKVSHFCSR